VLCFYGCCCWSKETLGFCYLDSCMIVSVLHMVSQEEFDTHDPKAHHFLKLPFLKKRSRIVEIGAARDTVFALTHSGICAAFSRGTEISPVVLRPYLLDVLLSAVFWDSQSGLGCTRHKQEDMFPKHQCRWSNSQFVLQQEQWFINHRISICFWQLQLLEVQDHTYRVCAQLFALLILVTLHL